jgi:hypothetical protein
MRHACLLCFAGMLELLQTSGALSEASEAEKFEDSLQGSDAASSSSSSSVPAAGSVWMHVENVVSDSAAEKAAAIAGRWCWRRCVPPAGLLLFTCGCVYICLFGS